MGSPTEQAAVVLQVVCTCDPGGKQHAAPPQSSGPSQVSCSSPAQWAAGMHPVATSVSMLAQQISSAPHTLLPQ